MGFIFLERSWFLHVPFVSMVKFESLAQIPVDPFSYPVVPTIAFLLSLFAAFTYVINCLIYYHITSTCYFAFCLFLLWCRRRCGSFSIHLQLESFMGPLCQKNGSDYMFYVILLLLFGNDDYDDIVIICLFWVMVMMILLFIYFYFENLIILVGCPCGVMVKALDYDIVVSESELQSRYNVHLWTNTLGERYDPPYPSGYGLNSITTVLLSGWLWH